MMKRHKNVLKFTLLALLILSCGIQVAKANGVEDPYGSSISSLIQYLLDGDIIGFVLACYVSRIGVSFYGIILLLVSGVLYNRTKSLPFVSTVWLLLGGTFLTLYWIFSPLAILLVIFGICGLLFSLFHKEGS